MYLLFFIVGVTIVPMILPENQFFHSLQIRKWEDEAMFQGMPRQVSCDQELYEGFADSNNVYNEDRLIMTVIYVLK